MRTWLRQCDICHPRLTFLGSTTRSLTLDGKSILPGFMMNICLDCIGRELHDQMWWCLMCSGVLQLKLSMGDGGGVHLDGA